LASVAVVNASMIAAPAEDVVMIIVVADSVHRAMEATAMKIASEAMIGDIVSGTTMDIAEAASTAMHLAVILAATLAVTLTAKNVMEEEEAAAAAVVVVAVGMTATAIADATIVVELEAMAATLLLLLLVMRILAAEALRTVVITGTHVEGVPFADLLRHQTDLSSAYPPFLSATDIITIISSITC
jgi:hypothetical protein